MRHAIETSTIRACCTETYESLLKSHHCTYASRYQHDEIARKRTLWYPIRMNHATAAHRNKMHRCYRPVFSQESLKRNAKQDSRHAAAACWCRRQQLHQRARWPVRCANLTKTLHYEPKYTGDTTRTRQNSRTRVLNATTRSSESHKHLRITTFKDKTTLQIVWYTYTITGAIAEKWHNWKRVSEWSERRCARNRSTSNVLNVMFDWRCSSEKVCSYDNGKRE